MVPCLSMTGLGRGEESNENFQLTVEIKSVNHRFKDFRFKTPSMLSGCEIELRKILEKNFKRGSFEIFVNFKNRSTGPCSLELDETKVQSFIRKVKSITTGEGVVLSVRPVDFLRSEFTGDDENDDLKKTELIELLYRAIDKAVKELADSRREEGGKLREIISHHLLEYKQYFNSICDKSSLYKEGIVEKLEKRLQEYLPTSEIDQGRLLQEVIYYVEKLEISEEINRIKVHCERLEKILYLGGEMGRNIDFLLQELNRETNTIGSKSGKVEISQAVIEMKVQLEKIREQALNLE